MSEPSSPDIVAELDAELGLIEPLPYRVPIHILAQRARDEIAALRDMVEKQRFVLSKGHAEVRAEERERLLAETPEAIEAMARAVWNTVDLPDAPPDVVKDEMRAALAALRAIENARMSEERTTSPNRGVAEG